MKKTNLLVLSAAAALFATSCSKDQVSEANPGNAIRFKSFAGATSKVGETTTADMADFKVYAFTGTTNDGFSKFFTDTYANNGGGTSFSPDGGTHYWPSNSATNCVFMGHSPADLSNVFDLTEGVGGVPTVTVEDPQTANIAGVKQLQQAESQVDLLVFRNHGTGADNGTSGVNLYMQHAMSQIVVQAVNYNADVQINVRAVKIFVKGKGTLSLPAQSVMQQNTLLDRSRWSVEDTYHSFVAGGKTATEAIPVSTTTTSATNLMFSEGGFMLIPQVLTGWTSTGAADGAYIAVLCNISQGGVQLFPSTPNGYGYAAVPISTTWDPGKKYTYTLQFFKDGGGAGVVPPTDPTDPTDPDPDPGTPGQPVLGGAISFNVTVQGWDTTTPEVETPMQGGTSSGAGA